MPMRVRVIKGSQSIFKNYSYLIYHPGGGDGAIIDPAWDKKDYENVLRETNTRLKYILLTHSHTDHTNLAASLAAKTGARVIISSMEAGYYRFQCLNLDPVEDRESLFLGDTAITPILTPGHTKGGFCYSLEGHLFTGDTLFIEGCGICSVDGGDPGEMFDSLQLLKSIVPFDTLIWPGHSYGMEPGLPFQEVFNYNIYLDFLKKNKFIEFRMRKNQKSIFSFK